MRTWTGALDREKLFVGLIAALLVLVVAVGVVLAYDVANDGKANTVALAPGQAGSTATDSGGGGAGAGSTPLAQPGLGGAAQSGPGAEAAGACPTAGSGAGATAPGAVSAPRVSGSSGVSGGNNITVAANDTILIGALITQSGPGNVSDGLKAMQAYAQYVNGQGGINGHKLALDVKDDAGNPSVGRPAFQQIVQEDHVFAIVGECAPITDGVLVGDINADQVPVVNDCLTSPDGYKSPYIWFNFLPSILEHQMIAKFMYGHQSLVNIHKPYVLCLDQATTLPYCDGFAGEWHALGGTTCTSNGCSSSGRGYDTFEIGTTRAQYESVALQIKNSGADSIVSYLEPTNQLSFLQALQDQGMSPSRPHSDGGWPQFAAIGMDQFVEQTIGDFGNGVVVGGFTYFPDETQFPGVQMMHDVINKYSPGTPIDTYAQTDWNPIVIFAEALRRMGSNVSRANLINTLNSMAGFSDGQQKPLSWSPTNHIGPLFTRYGTTAGPSRFTPITGWIDQNGNPTN